MSARAGLPVRLDLPAEPDRRPARYPKLVTLEQIKMRGFAYSFSPCSRVYKRRIEGVNTKYDALNLYRFSARRRRVRRLAGVKRAAASATPGIRNEKTPAPQPGPNRVRGVLAPFSVFPVVRAKERARTTG